TTTPPPQGQAFGSSTALAVGMAIVAATGTAAGTGTAAAQFSRFPLSVSSNGRYLVDAAGSPFFMIGDAAQSGAASPTLAEFQTYVDTRKSQGFNTININFIEHKYCGNPPKDRSGNMPFLTQVGGGSYTSTSQAPDWTSWNDTYFHGLEVKVA